VLASPSKPTPNHHQPASASTDASQTASQQHRRRHTKSLSREFSDIANMNDLVEVFWSWKYFSPFF
jgi:hypothetical protein